MSYIWVPLHCLWLWVQVYIFHMSTITGTHLFYEYQCKYTSFLRVPVQNFASAAMTHFQDLWVWAQINFHKYEYKQVCQSMCMIMYSKQVDSCITINRYALLLDTMLLTKEVFTVTPLSEEFSYKLLNFIMFCFLTQQAYPTPKKVLMLSGKVTRWMISTSERTTD